MIRFDGVTVTYPGAEAPALRDATFAVDEGELCLVVGPTGAGKSTLLGAASALVPHFTGGRLDGRVVVAGRDTRDHPPRALADVVGVVLQDPVRGFVTDTVEEELAYGMEQLGVPAPAMRQRVEQVLDALDLAPLRTRTLATLSGGEQQRVALGAVLTAHPRVLVLDEPTSALDPTAAEEVLATLTRLVHDLGLTVLLAEHRLERVVQYADRVVVVAADGTVTAGAPAAMLADAPVAPPVVELARLAGWSPTPLSVRDARRLAPALREQVADDDGVLARAVPSAAAAPLLTARRLEVAYGRRRAVRGVDLTVGAGEAVAVMGRNGAGKSSLLWALQGAGPRSGGSVTAAAPTAGGPPLDPATLAPRDARRRVALVPQEPQDLLYLDSVGAECRASDEQAGVPAGTTAARFAALLRGTGADGPGTVAHPAPDPATHPRDLSEGQRLALALAVQLAAAPRVLLLDEPTRGLDYAAKRRLSAAVADHAAGGGAVVLSSHDVEFVAETASRVLVLADGEVVADGPAREVLVASPTFAPQVAKVLHPLPLLTVDDVRRRLRTRA